MINNCHFCYLLIRFAMKVELCLIFFTRPPWSPYGGVINGNMGCTAPQVRLTFFVVDVINISGLANSTIRDR